MTANYQNVIPIGGGQRKISKPKTEILPMTDTALEYLTNTRMLLKSTIEAYRLGSDKSGKIVVPFYDEFDELALVKFRHPKGKLLKWRRPLDDGEWEEVEGKSRIESGGKGILFGSHLCSPTEGPLVICFGDYDAMTVAQDGVPNCTALPFGDGGFDFIKLQWSFLEAFDEIILYPDLDKFPNPEAEIRAKKKLDELAKRLGKHRVRLVHPEDRFGTKDANELLLKKGDGFNRKAIERAEWFPSGIVAVADYEEEAMTEGTPIGLPDIDRATGGMAGGQLIIISGDNGAGKTTEALNIAANFIEEGKPVFIWSGEQKVGKIRYWFERIVAGPNNLKTVTQAKTGFDFHFPLDEVKDIIRNWYRNYLFQYTEVGIDAQVFFEAAELAVRRYGCALVIVDNLMAFTGGEGEGYYQAQGDFAESCKRFAEKWDVAFILICHNKKEEENAKTPRLPDKNSVEGSKKITNWADLVFQLYRVPQTFREKFYGADSIMKLCKTRESGIFEDVRLKHDSKSNRLCQMSEEGKIHRRFGWEKQSPYYKPDEIDEDPRFK